MPRTSGARIPQFGGLGMVITGVVSDVIQTGGGLARGAINAYGEGLAEKLRRDALDEASEPAAPTEEAQKMADAATGGKIDPVGAVIAVTGIASLIIAAVSVFRGG